MTACAFTEGDVLYDDPAAYEAPCWRDALRTLCHALQVRRAAGLTSSFEANWNASVSLDWWDYRRGRCRRVEATQGELFTVLWTGELSVLGSGRAEPPPTEVRRALRASLRDYQPPRGAARARADNGRATTVRVGTAATTSQMALF